MRAIVFLLLSLLVCSTVFCEEEAKKEQDSGHIERLLRKLEIDDYVVRSATLNQLFNYDDKRIPPAVKRIFQTTSDEDTRYWCACLLLKCGDEEAKKFLIKGLRSESERCRYNAVAAFGRAKDKSALDEIRDSFKNDPVPQVQIVAAYALANLGFEEGYNFLKEKVRDDNWIAQDMAAVLLGWLKKEDSKPLLEQLFKSISSDNTERKGVKLCAAWGLAHFGSDEAERYLVEAGYDSLTAQVGICEVGKPMIDELLRALKESQSPAVRRNAATLLGILGGADVVKPLEEALKDRTYSVASAAATALGYSMHPDAVQPLAKLATNPEANIILRRSAIKSLSILHFDSCIEPLSRVLDGSSCKKKDDDSLLRLRENAALALAQIGTETAIKAFCSVLSDKNTPTKLRVSLCWTIKQQRISSALPTLVELLKEDEESLKKAAYDALKEISGKDYGTDYEKWKMFLAEKK